MKIDPIPKPKTFVMKKFFTILWLALAAFTFKATAQTTNCNANFTAQFLTNTTVKFNPASTDSAPAAYHTWTFGDGSPISHNVSPTHTFAIGTYAVVHTIVRPGTNGTTQCSQSFTLQITIQDCNLTVDFSWTVGAGNGLTYAFTNHSTPLSSTDSITWIFGDNTTSHDVNPTHSYANYGTYNVCLIVKKNNGPTASPCIKYTCKSITAVQPCNLVVDFNWTIAATNPLTYEFHNLSTPSSPTDSTIWSFGDGSSSTAPNPAHTYANAGTYTVCLTVKKLTPVGTTTCVRYLCKTIVVQNPCNLVVDFAWNVVSPNPLSVAFQNLSTPLAATDSITWTFGDGTTSHDVNPTHTYATGGSYNVCLVVKKYPYTGATPCIRYICKTVAVTSPCTLVVDFSWNVTGTGPWTVAFTNLSTPIASNDSITWTFGDGTSSHDLNPTHTYTAAGSYQVCLIIKKANTNPVCMRYICKTVLLQAPCTLVANFTAQPSTSNPLGVYFTNTSTGAVSSDSIRWTFGDGTSANSYNAYHAYAQAGTYNVCLRIIKRNANGGLTNCVSEKCDSVVVHNPCTLVANFTSQPSTSNPLGIYYTNTSTGAVSSDSIRWTFGDGTSANTFNAYHAYAQAGTYNVCLRIIKRNANGGLTNCISEKCDSVVVHNPCNLVVDFSWNVTSSSSYTVVFTNLSTPLSATDSITWTFGDGTSSHDVNPTHTYANAGTYNVCLIIKKYPYSGATPCIRYICKTVTLQVPCTLVANFTWLASTANSQSIYFTNTSTGAALTDSVRWTFGDGTSSNQYNTNHTYTQPGTYTVCLRMIKRNPNGGLTNCISEKCQTITVHPSCNFDATWTWHLDSANVKKVYFTNTTAIPTTTGSATWYFGDGTSATTWNAVHEYANPGRYNVCLRVEIAPNCVRYRCDSITVPVPAPPCNNQSNFTFVATSATSNTFTFTPAYQSSTVTYSWSFGDGTGSNAMIATHHYTQAGTYNVCLTVWRNAICVSTTCKTVAVTTQVNCDSIHVSYTYQADPYMPNKLYFYANANFPILDQTWTIERLPASTPPNQVVLHANNPSYVFNDTGYYRVCLRAVTLGGCIKEYCNYVHIEHIATQCQLTAYPNPASTEVHINVALTAPQMINVNVYNNLNVLVLQKQQQGVVGNNVVTLNIASLIAGYYTVRVMYGNSICNSAFQKL